MNKEEKEFEIKVPVYTSEVFESGSLLGGVTSSQLISGVKKLIDTFTLKPFTISDQKQNKITKREIDSVAYEDCAFFNDNDPALLIKVTAHNTNMADGYYQSATKVKIGKEDKIGSENNYFILYPNMLGVDPSKIMYQWIIMVYEDLNKITEELIKTVKLVLKNVLKIPVRNIKLKEVAEELKNRKLTELRVKYHTVTYDTDEISHKFSTYFSSGKITTQVEQVFKNIPFEDADEILCLETKKSGWDKLNFKLFDRKKEYRISKARIQEAMGRISSTSEAIFNERCPIKEPDLDKIYEKSFIVSKLEPILLSYISSTDGV